MRIDLRQHPGTWVLWDDVDVPDGLFEFAALTAIRELVEDGWKNPEVLVHGIIYSRGFLDQCAAY